MSLHLKQELGDSLEDVRLGIRCGICLFKFHDNWTPGPRTCPDCEAEGWENFEPTGDE